MDLPLTKTGFWDVDLAQMDSDKHADFIIARVFQYGLMDDLKAVVRHYTPEQIKHAIENTRGIMDSKALALAQLFTE
jgi:hypothetical protein